MATEIAQIDRTRCSGCGRCISACEFQLFSFETKAWKKTAVLHDIDRCNGCGECSEQLMLDNFYGLSLLAEENLLYKDMYANKTVHGISFPPVPETVDEVLNVLTHLAVMYQLRLNHAIQSGGVVT